MKTKRIRRNYSKLLGKEVTVTNTTYGTLKCVVTGVDFGLGITIQEVGTNRYILCLNRRVSLENQSGCTPVLQYIYDNIMGIGSIDLDKIIAIYKSTSSSKRVTTSVSANNCVFNQ